MDATNEANTKKEGVIERLIKQYESLTQEQKDFVSFGIAVPIAVSLLCFFFTVMAFSDYWVWVLLSYIAVTLLGIMTNVCTNYYDNRMKRETKPIGYIFYIAELMVAALSSVSITYFSDTESVQKRFFMILVFAIACIGTYVTTKHSLKRLGTEDNEMTSPTEKKVEGK